MAIVGARQASETRPHAAGRRPIVGIAGTESLLTDAPTCSFLFTESFTPPDKANKFLLLCNLAMRETSCRRPDIF